MESFLVSFVTVAVAEMGDRTQLLSLMLATQFRKPWPILAGVLVATIANHAAAGLIGSWLGGILTPAITDAVVGAGMVGMALWSLKPDREDGEVAYGRRGAFLATTITIFVAEIGDKTQIATVALAAGYPNLVAVVLGTTSGMVAANVPVIFLGSAFAGRLPMRALRYGASVVFALLGLAFLARAAGLWS